MRWLLALLVALALTLLAALGGAAWLFGTEAGLQWAAARARAASAGRLEIEGLSGALARLVHVERLTYAADGFRLEARNLSARADLLAALGGRLAIEPLRAASLEVALAADGGKPPSPPALPFGLRLGNVAIERFALSRGATRQTLHEVRLAHAELDAKRTVSLAGSFQRPDARFPASGALQLRGPVERLEAALTLDVAGVAAQARAVLTPFAARRLDSIDARAGPIDLARFDPALPHTALTATLKAQSNAGTLSVANAAAGPLDEERLPIARVEARLSSDDFASASLERLRIVLRGGGMLEGRGEASAGRFRASLQATKVDLREIRSTLRRTALSGPLRVVLEREAQAFEGTLSEEGISLSADLVRVGETLDVRALRATASGGELSGSGKLRLGAPARFSAQLRFKRFNPAAFGDYPEGELNGAARAQGRLGDQPQVAARWTLRDSTLVGLPLESHGNAGFSRRRISRAQAEATLGRAHVRVRGDLGRPGDELGWAIDAPRLEEIVPALAGRLRASGSLTGSWSDPRVVISAQAEALRLPRGPKLEAISARIAGTLARHEADISARAQGTPIQAKLRGGWRAAEGWRGELQTLASAGDYPLRLLSPATLGFARRRLELGRFEAALAQGRLLVRDALWTPGKLASNGEFTGLPAQWLIAAAGLAEHAQATLTLDGQWSFSAAPRLDGRLQLRRAGGDVALKGESSVDLELRSASLDARFVDGRVLANAEVLSRYAKLALEGEAQGIKADSQVSFRGQVDFADLRTLSEPLLAFARLDGRLRADLAIGGTLGQPRLTGTLNGNAIAFEAPRLGMHLRSGELRATLEGDKLRITDFSIQGGAGRFSLSGTLPLRLADGSAKLAWRAANFALLERPDLRLVASGEGEAGFDGKRLSLTGDLRAERGHIEIERERIPRPGDDVVVVGQTRPPAEQRLRLPLALDLQLDLGKELAIRGQGLDGKLAGSVQLVTNKDGELRAYGHLQTIDATFLAYGQKLIVDPGVLIFDGPIDNPSLQITAWRRNQAVEAGVQISGTARVPRVQLVSQPPVPEGERLSWLVLGRAPSDATQADLGLLQAAAGALLARGESLPVDRRIARAFGLDELSLRGTGEVQDRVVAFGKRLSDRLYISYEQGLGAVASNLVKLDLSLTQRWSLRAETGTSSGWGLFYRYSWD